MVGVSQDQMQVVRLDPGYLVVQAALIGFE